MKIEFIEEKKFEYRKKLRDIGLTERQINEVSSIISKVVNYKLSKIVNEV